MKKICALLAVAAKERAMIEYGPRQERVGIWLSLSFPMKNVVIPYDIVQGTPIARTMAVTPLVFDHEGMHGFVNITAYEGGDILQIEAWSPDHDQMEAMIDNLLGSFEDILKGIDG